jgi:hypothetical protein
MTVDIHVFISKELLLEAFKPTNYLNPPGPLFSKGENPIASLS